ncbi:MAG: hypothetical protein IJO26_00055 [Clostridium sp.]|nr:hypothetical protein [Clostridium sp.]
MNFNDNDSNLYEDDSNLRVNSFSSFQSFNPNPIPGFPGGPSQGSYLNVGSPPNFTPEKNSSGVKKLNHEPDKKNKKYKEHKDKGNNSKAVNPGTISFCLYKFTYIWEKGNKSYWAFLLNVDNRSISGLRWFRGTWVYFGLDIKKVDSFVCYRSNSEETSDSKKETLILTRKEFKNNETKYIYSKVLTSVDIPEERNDTVVNYLGEIEGNDLTLKIPCKQKRTVTYKIIIEVKFPESFNNNLIEDVSTIASNVADSSSIHLNPIRNSEKFLTPLEVFNNSTKNIGKTLKSFSEEFNNKLKKLKLSKETTRQIEYSIIQEKVEESWKIV